jgi:hypothetical protein
LGFYLDVTETDAGKRFRRDALAALKWAPPG